METNDDLVDFLKETGRIKSERVEEAFRNVDRARFVPGKYSENAYLDRPFPIGDQATISAPHMVAENTELLEPEEGNRIVEVGSGSGYQIAVLAEIADEVVGVEILEDLVEQSRERIEELGYNNVEIYRGSGLEPVDGEFDRILFSCAISPERFEEAKDRLTGDGILVAPVSEDGRQVVKKFKAGETTEHGRVRFVEFQD